MISSNYKVELKAKEKGKSVELGLGVREGERVREVGVGWG